MERAQFFAVLPGYLDNHFLIPEQVLLVALLERAIRDCMHIKGVVSPHNERHYFREVREWFGLNEPYTIDPDPEPFTFQWVCSYLDIDPYWIYVRLHKAVKGSQEDFTWLRERIYNWSFRRVPAPDRLEAKKLVA